MAEITKAKKAPLPPKDEENANLTAKAQQPQPSGSTSGVRAGGAAVQPGKQPENYFYKPQGESAGKRGEDIRQENVYAIGNMVFTMVFGDVSQDPDGNTHLEGASTLLLSTQLLPRSYQITQTSQTLAKQPVRDKTFHTNVLVFSFEPLDGTVVKDKIEGKYDDNNQTENYLESSMRLYAAYVNEKGNIILHANDRGANKTLVSINPNSKGTKNLTVYDNSLISYASKEGYSIRVNYELSSDGSYANIIIGVGPTPEEITDRFAYRLDNPPNPNNNYAGVVGESSNAVLKSILFRDLHNVAQNQP